MVPEFVVVGHINKAHGTRGELVVWPLTDHPDEVFAEGSRLRLGDKDGHVIRIPETTLQVDRVRPFQGGLLVCFGGVEDRTSAERLLDQYLVKPFEPPAHRPVAEYYYHELLGLEVVTVGQEVVGRVREVYELSPDHMLDVEGARGSVLIPLNSRIVTAVDLDAGRLTVDPPEGFLELQE